MMIRIMSSSETGIKRAFVFLSIAALWLAAAATPVSAHPVSDEPPRTAVVSAFPPELAVLAAELEDTTSSSINGVEFLTGKLAGSDVLLFLSGISTVNAAMTVQLALDHFTVERIVFSGIAGGVDPDLEIGDVTIVERWGQYLETVFARKVDDSWEKPPFFEYPYAGFDMMFPRSVTVNRTGSTQSETRFWFPVDETMIAYARRAAERVELIRCTDEDRCLPRTPKVVIGGSGISGSAFVDNAEFRNYAFRTFGARVLDMESAAVAHVAWANDVPFIAIRSLSDLAGGSEKANQIEIFFHLASKNAARVVMSLLRGMAGG